MTLSTHPAVKGTTYAVVCPLCYNPMNFECVSERMYGVRCDTCSAMIDLRNPTETLADNDGGVNDDSARQSEPVYYAGDVEVSTGLSASAQVIQLVRNVEAEKRKVMPTQMTGETTQAFAAQRNQALAEKFSFFYPVTYAIEYLVFGRTPYAKLGHVRIFRKRIPFYGYVNFCAPRTTTSYAAPFTFTSTVFILFNWFCAHMQLDWMPLYLYTEWVLVFLFFFLMFRLAYSDPGYIKPGYMEDSTQDGNGVSGANGELTLRDIESNQKDSIWEMVDGVPMERKWCASCAMHRPVRAAHCYICGLCCYDHDHHCSVIGVCVGRRRVEMFSCFVAIAATACLLPTVVILYAVYTHPERITTTLQMLTCAFLVVPVTFFAALLSATAVGMCLSCVQETTTRERIQRVYVQKRNPFNRGVLRNLQYHLLQRRVAPSIFDDEFVKECARHTEERELGTAVTVTCV
ncbi:putative palmitoyl acyltransferase 4 [Leptomonas pyrrhocoris]|uniref:Palmitoyltransferase n=1 Tax=Leptomonas pyrrhocoris TaxID=157538 RepID=A0A0M9G947_LEPPY|nr:putative palmitoyl acyltransferase 4 [Leptomonas pyrrhocoris]KPA85267.1 putative palmitoyl acyltransferase 4 [Leptomonas pyrrhocoris]|eukprot:XP_015663706.1 putative palmitoyl acyltransferase 4 [Leptomonas pyrrhocoris]